MRRPHATARAGQRGMSLMEVVLAGALMTVVLVAVTGVAMSFNDRARDTGDLIADQEAARDALGRLTMELRSAGPGQSGPVLLRSAPDDLAFATDSLPEAPGQWRAARYCRAGEVVIRQVGTALAAPATACPDPAWGVPEPVASGVRGALFDYSTAVGATPAVAVTFDVGAARPLESAITVRNRALVAGAVSCAPTDGNNALLTIGAEVGQQATIAVKLADLPGLEALLFGTSAPPPEWGCP